MAFILIKHKVKDYTAWKSAFDSFYEKRKSGGEKSYHIFHVDGEPNNLIVLFEWDNLDNARLFMNSPDLKEAMQGAGVIEIPDIHFLEEIEIGSI